MQMKTKVLSMNTRHCFEFQCNAVCLDIDSLHASPIVFVIGFNYNIYSGKFHYLVVFLFILYVSCVAFYLIQYANIL